MDAPTTVFRFGPFDLDLRTGELRKTGQMVHLPPQPFKVLALLVRRRGDVVTRDEIHKEIWNEATFVDFDQGLNFCIRRIREALGDNAALRALEAASHTLFRDFMIAARAFLEQQPEESLAAVNRIVTSTFGDPEGLFYLTRHLAQLNNPDAALRLFRRVVDGGYFCFPAMARDPWLDPIRKTSEFRKLLDRISARHDEAVGVFSRMQGDVLLGVAPRSGIEGRRRTGVQPSH